MGKPGRKANIASCVFLLKRAHDSARDAGGVSEVQNNISDWDGFDDAITLVENMASHDVAIALSEVMSSLDYGDCVVAKVLQCFEESDDEWWGELFEHEPSLKGALWF